MNLKNEFPSQGVQQEGTEGRRSDPAGLYANCWPMHHCLLGCGPEAATPGPGHAHAQAEGDQWSLIR